MAQVELSEAQAGARIVVHAGDIVIVRLTERSGGGYRWTPASVDAARLEMQEHHYETTRAGVGSAGASVWTFVARTAGSTRLELKQLRPWEPSDTAAERFWVDLDIRE